ncbi:(Fe-S)-binding protein [Desulfolucanica intricata]|uniref:(Fe-S)-binding protein n=1 Tax=Desulfolucanica intricata TaxID=1285191 RepID=UPI00350E3D88
MLTYKLLPHTNCGDCSQKSCMAFAGQLIKQASKLDECNINPLIQGSRIPRVKFLPLQGCPGSGWPHLFLY